MAEDMLAKLGKEGGKIVGGEIGEWVLSKWREAIATAAIAPFSSFLYKAWMQKDFATLGSFATGVLVLLVAIW